MEVLKIEWQILLVATGGAFGALVRFAISSGLSRFENHPFPWGTLVANVVGCFLIGLLIGSGLADRHHAARLGFGVGFLGALTTFSTFGAETVGHVQSDQWGWAITNVSANLVLGMLGVFAGMALGKRYLS